MLTTWSFFTGAMGLDLGLEAEGLHPSVAVEVDPIFCDTIRTNRPDLRVLERDIATLDADELGRATGDSSVDLIVGGPPCQSFCPEGRARPSQTRGATSSSSICGSFPRFGHAGLLWRTSPTS